MYIVQSNNSVNIRPEYTRFWYFIFSLNYLRYPEWPKEFWILSKINLGASPKDISEN